MKRGLNVTLMTVAIAVLALQASAMAPVIDAIPSPIVGNEQSITFPNIYVFPDAFNLDAKVTDDTTADANILWSYALTGTAIYRINNVDPVTVGTDNIDAPGAKRLNGNTTDTADVDGKSNTITIRNTLYSAAQGPSGTGIIDSQVVTLFASDGTTYSSKSVLFFTDIGGNDRLSPPDTYPLVYHPDMTATNPGFTYAFIAGTVTSSTGANGMCLETVADNQNMAQWNSPLGSIPISANTVYRIRARVNGNQASAGTVPLFDFIIQNQDEAAAGLELYGADFLILDNEGGANAAYNKPTTSGTTYSWLWAPVSAQTAAWNDPTNGVYKTSVTATQRGARFVFRVLDVTTNAATSGNLDLGKICLNSLTIEAIPYSALTITPTSVASTSLTAATFQALPLVSAASSITRNTDGSITFQPDAGGQAAEYAKFYPGAVTIEEAVVDRTKMAGVCPVVWTSNKLYQIVFDLSAPDAAGATNPPDVFWVGMDTVTNELAAINLATAALGKCAMPKQGAAQQFVSYMYSHTETTSLIAEFHRFRPRFEVGNNASLTDSTDAGGIKIHGYHVNEVSIAGGN